MGSCRSEAPLFLLIITFLIYRSSAQHGRFQTSALVTGRVFCDICSHPRFPAAGHFLSGATVSIECGIRKAIPSFKQEVETGRMGEFKVKLPFSVNQNTKRIKTCTLRLVRSSEPYCSVASMAVSATLKLKSRIDGEHLFTAGVFTFKPLQQPKSCNQNHAFTASRHDLPSRKRLPTKNPRRKEESFVPALVSGTKIRHPAWFFSPPTIPLLPSPPSFPFPLPPNPFQPPPLLPIPSPPNPFQPPPLFNFPNPFHPPSYFPPIPFLNPPPPPPFLSFPKDPNPFHPPSYFPPIPFLNPPPPPPFFSFPPFPFPNPFHHPSPLIPGIPPAAPSENGKKEETTHL